MGIAASELVQHVIRPTLQYLNRQSDSAENLLLVIAACQSHLCSHLDGEQGHGIYCISDTSHLHLWDTYLACDPDLASLVRGLASQHAFLKAPHMELTVNLRYATAIAWFMVEANTKVLPIPDTCDVLGMANLWKKVFRPHGRTKDFVSSWDTFVVKLIKAA